VNWKAYGKWLRENFSYNYSKDLLNYSKRFSYVLFSGEASSLHRLSGSVRRMAMASLSNLSKFLGVHGKWKRIVEAYGLKWSSGKAEDFLLSRMANTKDADSILDWVRQVKAKIPQLSLFMNFMLLTGLRLKEAVNSWNLIVDLAEARRLSEYYDREKEVLEHYKFKKVFIRRSKKVFVSFVPERLIEEISKQGKLTIYQINNWVRRDNKLKSRFGDLREFWATFMTRYLTTAEIDFLQGRVGASIFMRNYFNPALITDLKERVFKGLAELQSRL